MKITVEHVVVVVVVFRPHLVKNHEDCLEHEKKLLDRILERDAIRHAAKDAETLKLYLQDFELTLSDS